MDVDHPSVSNGTSLRALLLYSIFGLQSSSIKHLGLTRCPAGVALPTGSYVVGFGYPLKVERNSIALGSVSQLPTLLSFTLQSFAPSRRSKKSSRFFFPLLRFSVRPFDLTSALQWLDPIWKAVLLNATRRFRPGRRLLLSWVF
jgi:hypothetical protein